MSWQEVEERGFSFLKEMYPNAILYGGENSNFSDVYIPESDEFIEIKDISSGCRCGQFTLTTAGDKDYCLKIIENNYTINDIYSFIREHYLAKKVKKFLIYDGVVFSIYTMEEFLLKFNFSVQTYQKRSGTRKVPKRDIKKVLAFSEDFYVDDFYNIKNTDSSKNGSYFSIDNDEYFINNLGIIRKRSKTKNQTWLIEVKNDKIN